MVLSILTYIMVSMATHLVIINGILFNLGGVHKIPTNERVVLFIGMLLMLCVLVLLMKYGNHTMLTLGVGNLSRAIPSLHIIPIVSLLVSYLISANHPLLLGVGISGCFCGWQYVRILMTIRHHEKYDRKES